MNDTTTVQFSFSARLEKLLSNFQDEKNIYIVDNFISPGCDLPPHEEALRFDIVNAIVQGQPAKAAALLGAYEMIVKASLAAGLYDDATQSGLWHEFFADVEGYAPVDEALAQAALDELLVMGKADEDVKVKRIRFFIMAMRRIHWIYAPEDVIAAHEDVDPDPVVDLDDED